LGNQFDYAEPIVNAPNNVTSENIIGTFLCASDSGLNNTLLEISGALSMSMANYVGNGGSFEWSFIPALGDRHDGVLTRTLNQKHNGIKLSSITDGTSNTFFAGETLKYGFIWDPTSYGGVSSAGYAAKTLSQVRTGHGEFNPDPETSSDAVKRNSYASNHPGGANFVFVDGSTHFIPETIEHNRLTYDDHLTGLEPGIYQRFFGRDDGQVVILD